MKMVKSLVLPTFDLTMVMGQLKADPHYADWPVEKLQQAETEYRQFVALCRSNPGERVMPTRLGDAVWHQHILNTKQYVQDTRDYLGYYLHHQPTTPSEEIIEASHRMFGEHFGCKERFVVMCYCTDDITSTIEQASEQAFLQPRAD